MALQTQRPLSAGDPDAGFPDLIQALTADAKHLVASEARLARLELRESLHHGARGALWLGIAFGVAILATMALTIALVAAVGAIAGGNLWAGALIVGAVEVLGGIWLVRIGLRRFGSSDSE